MTVAKTAGAAVVVAAVVVLAILGWSLLSGNDSDWRNDIFEGPAVLASHQLQSDSGGRCGYMYSEAIDPGVHLLRRDDCLLVQITDNGWDLFSVPSPNEQKMAFIRWDGSAGSNSEIHELDLTTGEMNQLTDTPTFEERDVSWSPDGSQIAYAQRDLNQVLLPSGDRVRTSDWVWDLMVASTELGAPPRVLLSGRAIINYHWSPDGQYIAAWPGTDDSRIVRVDVETGEIVELADDGWGRVLWSPNGTWIAYQCLGDRDPLQKSVCLVTPDGSDHRAVEAAEDNRRSDVYAVGWSADGQRLMYIYEHRHLRIQDVSDGTLTSAKWRFGASGEWVSENEVGAWTCSDGGLPCTIYDALSVEVTSLEETSIVRIPCGIGLRWWGGEAFLIGVPSQPFCGF